MTKNEFLQKLEKNMSDLDAPERERLLEYYSEILDDMTDSGLSVDEAITELAVGNFDLTLPEDDIIDAEASVSDSEPENLLVKISSEIVRSKDFPETPSPNGPFSDVLIETDSVSVRLEPSQDRNYHVDYNEYACSCDILENGPTLQIRISSESHQNLFNIKNHTSGSLFNLKKLAQALMDEVCISLPDAAYRSLRINSQSGDLEVNFGNFTDEVLLSSVSGDINIPSEIRTRNFVSSTVSGDFCLDVSPAAENIELHSVSGDIAADELRCASFRSVTQSGDMEIEHLSCPDSVLSSASGDINVTLDHPVFCELHSSSGDVEYPRISEGNGHLKATTASGDICIQI